MNNDILFRKASAKELIAYASKKAAESFPSSANEDFTRRMQLAHETGTLAGIIYALVSEIRILRSRNHDMQMTIDRFISIR